MIFCASDAASWLAPAIITLRALLADIVIQKINLVIVIRVRMSRVDANKAQVNNTLRE